MLKQKQEKKPPRLAMWGMVAAGTAIVTEDVTVIATMEYGCVGESRYGISVVVPECSAQVGDILSATFYVPSMELNGYYDRLQDRVEMVQP